MYTIRCRKRVFQDYPPEPIIAIIVCSSRDKPFKHRRNRTSPGTYCVIRGMCASHGPRSRRLGAHYNYYYYHYRYLRPRESLRLFTYIITYVSQQQQQQQQECSSPFGRRVPPGKVDSGTKRKRAAVCRTRVFKRLDRTLWEEKNGLFPIRSVYAAFSNARYFGQQAKKRGRGKNQKTFFRIIPYRQ